MPRKLSHYDGAGRAQMVDVSGKSATKRQAEASAFVVLKPAILQGAAQESQGRSSGGCAFGRDHGGEENS